MVLPWPRRPRSSRTLSSRGCRRAGEARPGDGAGAGGARGAAGCSRPRCRPRRWKFLSGMVSSPDVHAVNSVSLTEGQLYPRKNYPADPGFIRTFDASGRTSVGHALETAVLNELERRGAEVGYVKTADGLEVDFRARHPGAGEELIQVCADPAAPEVLSRELRALTAAARDHPRAGRWLLVLDRVAAFAPRRAVASVSTLPSRARCLPRPARE